MRLMVLWTTYGLCSFCLSSFSSYMNFFFTAGNLRRRNNSVVTLDYDLLPQPAEIHRMFPSRVTCWRVYEVTTHSEGTPLKTPSHHLLSPHTWSFAQTEPEIGFFSLNLVVIHHESSSEHHFHSSLVAHPAPARNWAQVLWHISSCASYGCRKYIIYSVFSTRTGFIGVNHQVPSWNPGSSRVFKTGNAHDASSSCVNVSGQVNKATS